MSAPDAAPLPRQGEVFFDVRGEARVLRLSWYADTGIAVFSIWQGGTCTGTFRLPIDELPRMVETLRRGPSGPAAADPGPPTEAVGATARPDRPAGAAYRPVLSRAEAQEAAEEQTELAEGGFSYGSRKTYVSQQTAAYDDPAGYDEHGDYGEPPHGPPRGPLPVGRWHDDQDEHYPPGASRLPGPRPGLPPGGDRYGPDEEDHYLPGETDPLGDYGPERGYHVRPGEAGPPAGYAPGQGHHARPGEAGSPPGYAPEQGYRAREFGAGRADEDYGGYPPASGHGGHGPEPDDGYRSDHGGYPPASGHGGHGLEPDDGYRSDHGYSDHGYPARPGPDDGYAATRGYPAHPEPLDHGYPAHSGTDDGYGGPGPGGAEHGDHFEPDPLSDDHEAEQGYLSGPMTGVFGALEGGYDLETVGPGYHAGPGQRPRGEGRPRGDAEDPGRYDPGRYDPEPPPASRRARGEARSRGEEPVEREYRPSRGRS